MPIYTNNTSMANCMVGDNQVSKILLNDQIIWENYIDGQYTGSKEFYSMQGTEQGTQYWSIDLGTLGLVTSVSISSSKSKYTLKARPTTSDSWTTLAYWGADSGGEKTITNKTHFRYFQIVCEGASYMQWIDPAGFYYWAYARGLVINYRYKKGS
jgi:hypothetical protein